MNRGKSLTMKSVSSWTRLPNVQSIFPTIKLTPSKMGEDQVSSIGGSFKSTQSAVSLQSRSTSEDSGFASNSSYPRSPIKHDIFTPSSSNRFKDSKLKMPQSESCFELNPIPGVSNEKEGQESSLNQDKLFITRL